ncbi:pepsin/retropepsin-like aspartic protease family protein [Catalinimonas sp. 4WD22]|uniref:pepsin/retropepsin-like aspartic protease family protein n=1 Tax=Catalinimonas locisalis TaxID=3133978 RepID=UPI003100A97B
MISIIMMVRNISTASQKAEQHQVHFAWNGEEDKFTLPFLVGKHGHILLKSQVNDSSGFFLFDTGASFSTLHESISGVRELQHTFTLTDAQGLQRSKKLRVMRQFQIGNIKVNNLVFWPTDSSAWKKGGPFEGQDELIGVIGNNFLTHYVWGFNMPNQQVTLTKSIDALSEMDGMTQLPLKNMEGNWYIPVQINNITFNLLLDFGYTTSIRLQDSLSRDDNSDHGIALSYSPFSAFSHTQEKRTVPDTVQYTMAESVSLGDLEFTNVMCTEKQYNSLIGLQFLWAFDRIILDYPNQKMYLSINTPENEVTDLSAVTKQKMYELHCRRQIQEKGFFEIDLNYHFSVPTQRITHHLDTVEGKYLFYGKSRHWGRSYFNKDSVTSLDSVRLPNGKIKQAPITIDLTNGYFVDP